MKVVAEIKFDATSLCKLLGKLHKLALAGILLEIEIAYVNGSNPNPIFRTSSIKQQHLSSGIVVISKAQRPWIDKCCLSAIYVAQQQQ